jgi:hypothetical protein
MKRHLILKSERLAELTSGDLASVAGAAATTNCFTGIYPSINYPCTTLLSPVTPVIDPPDSVLC